MAQTIAIDIPWDDGNGSLAGRILKDIGLYTGTGFIQSTTSTLISRSQDIIFRTNQGNAQAALTVTQQGRSYERLNYVSGNGKTTTAKSYCMTDITHVSGMHFELMVDMQLTSNSSAVRHVFGTSGGVDVFLPATTATGAPYFSATLGGTGGAVQRKALGRGLTIVRIDGDGTSKARLATSQTWTVINTGVAEPSSLPSRPLAIFGRSTSATAVGGTWGPDLCYIKIWTTDESQPYSYLLPGRRITDGVVGFWDAVRKKFYVSTTSTPFTGG